MKGFTYATGRRKESVARVWVKPESRKDITVNDKKVDDYFCREDLILHLSEPLRVVDMEDTVEVRASIRGGGIRGQAGALRLGIARALVDYDPELRTPLKKAGLLTRDPREVERKKYGKKKARKSFQFSKR